MHPLPQDLGFPEGSRARRSCLQFIAPALMLCLAALGVARQSIAGSAVAPDLTITKTHTGNFTQSQNAATYTITVNNVGAGAVLSGNTVTVTDTMPASGLTAI